MADKENNGAQNIDGVLQQLKQSYSEAQPNSNESALDSEDALENVSHDELQKRLRSQFLDDEATSFESYDDNYSIGEYCKTIEGFMIGFVECDPIMDDDDIPEFISIDDMLDRYLKEVPNADSIGIYKTNGILIAKKERTKNNIK